MIWHFVFSLAGCTYYIYVYYMYIRLPSLLNLIIPIVTPYFCPQGAPEQERVREHRRRFADRVVDQRAG